MKVKDNNKKAELRDLFRYLKEKMTGRERHAFERELQKDPFSNEAFEGFSEISPEESEADLERLERQIKSRSSRRNRLLYFRIAASVTVLMILSSVYLFIGRNKPSDEPARYSTNIVPFDIPESKSIKEPQPSPQKDILAETGRQAERKIVTPEAQERPGEEISAERTASLTAKKTEITPMTEAKEDDIIVDEVKMAAAAPADKLEYAEPEIIKSVNDTVTTALNQIVAVGYGSDKRSRVAAAGAASKSESVSAGYLRPAPINGQKSFDNYIEKNIRKPLSFINGQRIDVVVSFLVKTTGEIDSIKVITSPGEEFSEEAIRLIKEGPVWKPAVRNGVIIDDKVRFNIVFK